MAHRGEKGTDENVKTELLVTNYPTEKSTVNVLDLLLYD